MHEPEWGNPAYVAGYMAGMADTGARLIGVVAAELGFEHPLIERMVERLGQIGPPGMTDED